MEVVKQITKEQLEKIQDQQSRLQRMLADIGAAEAQKHAMLHALADVNKEIEETKAELEAEYGAIGIDLKDGSYQEVEKKSE
jgi:peptidoglycan hydrolase CwlO-like protein